LAAAADFLDGDNWQDLCLSEPDRALWRLDAAKDDWTPPDSLANEVRQSMSRSLDKGCLIQPLLIR
jgi:hypothetical protein